MGIFFGFQICLCAEVEKYFCGKNEEQLFTLQKALLHGRRLQSTAEGFKAQQTALKHNRQVYCIADSFIAEQKALRQKALLHSRKLHCTVESFATQQKKSVLRQKLEKKTSAAETEDKYHVLPDVSVLLADKTQFAHKPDQIELQLDRSQLPYSKYSGPIPQAAAQPTLTTKRPTTRGISKSHKSQVKRREFSYRQYIDLFILFKTLLLKSPIRW